MYLYLDAGVVVNVSEATAAINWLSCRRVQRTFQRRQEARVVLQISLFVEVLIPLQQNGVALAGYMHKRLPALDIDA